MATAIGTPSTPKVTTSVDPLYTQAVDQAKAAAAAASAPIQAQQTASDQYYAQRQTDATDEATALSKLLEPIGPAVSATYGAAAQNQGLLAQGFSHGMEDALQGNTDNLNSMLTKLGQPVQLDSHATQAGDVTYGLGGYIPGSTFNREGAAFGAAANMLPGTALLRGQETAKQLGIQGDAAHADFANKLAEVASKIPGDAVTNYDKLRSLALEDQKFALQVQNAKFDQAYKTAELNLKGQSQAFNQKATAARINLEANKFAQQTLNQNRSYQLSLARLGLATKAMQLRVTAEDYKLQNGGFTPAQLSKLSGTAYTIADQAHSGKSPSGTFPPLSYGDAVKSMLEHGVPLSLAEKALRDAGYRPGDLLGTPAQPIHLSAAQVSAYNTMVGAPAKVGGTFTLATGPSGQKIKLQMPANVTPAIRSIVSGAVAYLGTPYAWGGESPSGFDCSGLAQFLYAKAGVSIPRTTYAQFQTGTVVAPNQLQAGDLVFFKGSDSRNGLPGHVGIYVGNGQFIEAPHTGSVVKVSTLAGYPGYMGARRYTKPAPPPAYRK
jgi:cell wall-associated NlpC family hydrolase